ncbi:MAG: hypothetical protein BWX72_00181 [Firmicutes bacterium ADurb.Bin080]|jgi:hypothetical protein|nr:MAG: hypothetical protein BWX72_00181 [Firmicutes bacterium ADurb.Bin080]
MKWNYNNRIYFVPLILYFFLLEKGYFACKDNPVEFELEEVELIEIDDPLENPFKGFATWIGDTNPMFDEKLQYATFAWRDIEPQKGVYNWSRLEQGWGDVQKTEKRVGFRIAACIPGSEQNDIPQWLIDEGVSMRPYSIDGHQGFAPDWDDTVFLAAHHDFITALGSRYDQDPRVAWIDIGSYGFWGEWHVWLNESLSATQETKQAILEDYFQAFPTKPKVIAFDDDFATKYVTERGGGIRNDCLGTEASNNWYLKSLDRINPTLNENVWKTAIITGEFCGGTQGAIDGTTLRFNLNFDFIKQTHWSFIGPAGGAIQPQSEEHRKNLELLHKTLGYRFVIRRFVHRDDVKKGENFEFDIQIENKGIAPFYFQWPFVVYFTNENDSTLLEVETGIDIREWLPGTWSKIVSIYIPVSIPAGVYNIKLAVHDPNTNEPALLFANTNKDQKLRYLVSRVRVM